MKPDAILIPEVEGPGHDLERSPVRADVLMPISTRVGVWGLLGGLVASLSSVWGFPFSFGFSGVLSGLGFLAGGLGATVASALVLRRTSPSFRNLRAAALVGVPFGILTALRATIVLWFPEFWLEHPEIFSLISLSAFGLGLGLIVLFVAGLLKNLRSSADSDLAVE